MSKKRGKQPISKEGNRLEKQIRQKLKGLKDGRELNNKFDALIKIQQDMGRAFRDTLDRVEKDFIELRGRVEKLEGK